MNESFKLLIIDDDHDILKILSTYFRNHAGYTVITADNGLDALKILKAQSHQINLVITDLMMDDIGGIGVISVLKKKFPMIPVIAMTGWGENLQDLAREKKAELVLAKPLNLGKLNRQVTQLLSERSPYQNA